MELESWREIFVDKTISTAISDRLLHHCTVFKIKGKSFRTCNVANNEK